MKINLPIELSARDYHEFSTMKDTLNSVLVNEKNEKKEAVSFIETGVWDREYHAYFHDANVKPTNDEVLKYYIMQYKGEFKNAQEIKMHFETDFLNPEFMKNFDEVLKSVELEESLYKISKKMKM